MSNANCPHRPEHMIYVAEIRGIWFRAKLLRQHDAGARVNYEHMKMQYVKGNEIAAENGAIRKNKFDNTTNSCCLV